MRFLRNGYGMLDRGSVVQRFDFDFLDTAPAGRG